METTDNTQDLFSADISSATDDLFGNRDLLVTVDANGHMPGETERKVQSVANIVGLVLGMASGVLGLWWLWSMFRSSGKLMESATDYLAVSSGQRETEAEENAKVLEEIEAAAGGGGIGAKDIKKALGV